MKPLIFPVLAIAFALGAYNFPSVFTPPAQFVTPIIKYTLIIIMLSMGLSLSTRDFCELFMQKKGALVLGAVLQFSVMPFLAWIISLFLGLDDALTIGMMLVGTTAGGTASNVMTYLAKGDLSLSVSMTLLSTLLSVVMMPLLTLLYIGESIRVDAIGMLKSLAEITLAPIIIGVLVNTLAPSFVKRIEFILPVISMVGIISLIAIIIALNASKIASSAAVVFVAVIAHNGLGLASGYFIARAFGFSSRIARTIAIEVGMQNSGLAISLAKLHFASYSLAAIPGAIFSIWHNISGAIFAAFISRKER
ncbi:bile acid:sodium symporter family protein [Campylobacter sp. 19-13652]|uniref:bile acid:sodium symporter family protein n=1 Tax=Campylobacter sp. 19-13652 TaxID=2840180 RepID=UPI001C78EBA6|nr:bile acid:sodium symporter family protein [Campylobacter sp. 19-13652]BCX80214.1 sodium transporter [Campylobacter sp. 19-13652]